MNKRGKKRQVSGYWAQRGWYYGSVQKVVCKWEPELGGEVVRNTFQNVRRVMEDGHGLLAVNICGRAHASFLLELLAALRKLHKQGNLAGYLIRFGGRLKSGLHYGELPLLSYEDLAALIKHETQRSYTVDSIKKCAQRLKLVDGSHDSAS